LITLVSGRLIERFGGKQLLPVRYAGGRALLDECIDVAAEVRQLTQAKCGHKLWYELASTNTRHGGFRVRYALPRPGVVHVRLAFPNGNYAVHTIDVT
jgi:hypothetical protein